jgi:HemY protein
LGWHVESSVPVLLVALLLIGAGLTGLLRLVSTVARLPGGWAARRAASRRTKGYQALTDGLAAAAVGETVKARKLADRAERLLPDTALTRLLSAQAAQLAGDAARAEDHFTAMLDRPETTGLGLRGLLTQALERGDETRAIELAARARTVTPGDRGLVDTLFALLVKAGRLREAQDLLSDAVRRKALPAGEVARRRALVLNERAAQAAAEGDSRHAFDFAKQAVAADPGFSAAVLRLAGLHAAAGRRRRAAGVLEMAWSRQPAPGLAEAYANLVPDDQPMQRLRRMEKLVAGRPDDPLAHMALAEAALAAQTWGVARAHLLKVVEAQPSGAPYRLLARLEQDEYGDRDAARKWLDKAASAPPDAAWSCGACGKPAAEWSLTCPHCGALDRLAWATAGRPVVEPTA